MCGNLAACGGGTTAKETTAKETTVVAESQTETLTAEAEKVLRICVLYDTELEDEVFHDSCLDGAVRASEEFGAEVVFVEFVLGEDWRREFADVCGGGYDLVIGTSAGFADLIVEYAEHYPETTFVVVDADVTLSNVQSICFSQKEGYFLAGAAAAMVAGNANAEDADEEAVIGWVCGIDIPMIREWFAAYEQGAKYVNPDIQVTWAVAGQWEESETGKALITAQMEQGAAAVMYVPFDIGAAATDALAGNGLYLAEVDVETASEPEEGQKKAEAVLASVVRKPGAAVYDAIRQMSRETIAAGSQVALSLTDDAVELKFSDGLAGIVNDEDAEEIRELCKALKEKISAGEIVVGSSEETEAESESEAESEAESLEVSEK